MGNYVGAAGGQPARGCGTRVKGGIYLEMATGPEGTPFPRFVFCPPRFIPEGIVVPALGQQVAFWEGHAVVMDHIGANHYPNVADVLDEANTIIPGKGLFGFSRKIAPFVARQLTAMSWYQPIHDRAFILNWMDYPPRSWGECPQIHRKHGIDRGNTDRDMPWFDGEYPFPDSAKNFPYTGCSGYWWEDVEGGHAVANARTPGLVTRRIGDIEYTALARPRDIPYRYERGRIGMFPIHGLVVVDGDRHSEETLRMLQAQASLPVEMVEE